MLTAVPGATLDELADTTYFAAGPTTVETGDALPVNPPPVAVITCDVPATVFVVNTTVAVPVPVVVVLGAVKLPPPVLDQPTTIPPVLTGFPYVSDNCAVTVTVPPAVTDAVFVVTRKRAAGPATVVTGALDPVRLLASVPVNVYVGPAVVFVVNSIVATPYASVVDVDAANVSPALLARAPDRGCAARARATQ